jgi:hypothetical protein
MSTVTYSTGSNSGSGNYSVNWDNGIWYGDPNNNTTKWVDMFSAKPEPASKLDIECLEREIQDLRKVLTELMEILGGKIK